MKIRIISRVSAVGRRRFQMDQMRRLDLAFEFVDAVEAAELSDEHCQQAVQTWPGSTLPQDIACFYSHRKSWEQVVADGALCLILEDDAVLADTIAPVLAAIEKRHADWRHVYDLEFTPEPHIIADTATWRDEAGVISASRVYRNRVGLAGYVIGSEAASRLLRDTTRYRLIDSYVWQRHWLHGQMIEPAQVVQMRFLPDVSQESAFVRGRELRAFKPKSRLRNFLLQMAIELSRGRSLLMAAGRSNRRRPQVDWSKFTRS